MNLGFYFLDFSVALIAVGAFLHISRCDREHVTRAEFDKHLAEMRVELKRLGASGRNDSVADDGVDEVGERNDCSKRYKDGGFCFLPWRTFTKFTAERNDK